VRYNGGTVSTKVDPKDWNNELTVISDLITFKLKAIQLQKFSHLPPSSRCKQIQGTMVGPMPKA